MTDDPKQVIADPDCVPVRHVTGVITNLFGDGRTMAMNLVTDRMGIHQDGSTYQDLIVVARLRFDLGVAQRIRDQIDVHLSGITSRMHPDQKPN